MAATASIEIAIYGKFQRELIEVGTVHVECKVKPNGRIAPPTSKDLIKAFKRAKVA